MDEPVLEREGDELGRSEFADTIVTSIVGLDENTSVVYGIYGSWGAGKTSVLNFIEEGFKASHGSSFTVKKFNPWFFDSEASLLLNFFNLLKSTLLSDNNFTDKKVANVKKIIAKYAGVTITGGSQVTKFLTGVDPTVALEKLLSLTEDNVFTLKEKLSKLLLESDLKIIILMDDIDRLDDKEVQSVFRLLKLSGDLPNIHYVIALDHNVVANALQKRYSKSDSNGVGFLEKVVQIPMHLPMLTSSQVTNVYLKKLTGIQPDNPIDKTMLFKYREIVQGLFKSHSCSPRTIKQLVFSIDFAIERLKYEVNILDLMLLETIRVMHLKLYDLIRERRHQIKHGSSSEYLNELIHDALPHLRDFEYKSLRNMIECMTQPFEDVSGSNEVISELQNQRFYEQYYTDRYFSYRIPENQVSDSAVLSFIRNMPPLSMHYSSTEKCITEEDVIRVEQWANNVTSEFEIMVDGKRVSDIYSQFFIHFLMNYNFLGTEFEPKIILITGMFELIVKADDSSISMKQKHKFIDYAFERLSYYSDVYQSGSSYFGELPIKYLTKKLILKISSEPIVVYALNASFELGDKCYNDKHYNLLLAILEYYRGLPSNLDNDDLAQPFAIILDLISNKEICNQKEFIEELGSIIEISLRNSKCLFDNWLKYVIRYKHDLIREDDLNSLSFMIVSKNKVLDILHTHYVANDVSNKIVCIDEGSERACQFSIYMSTE